MITIISRYHKKLHFQLGEKLGGKSLGINPNQVISVEDEVGKTLIENPWIERVDGQAPVFGRCGVPFGIKPVKRNRTEVIVEEIKKEPLPLNEIKEEPIEKKLDKEEPIEKSVQKKFKRSIK